MRKPSSKIKEDIARLQEQLKVAETREAERIGRLALKAGLGEIEIDDAKLVEAFEELAKRFVAAAARPGNLPLRRTKLARLRARIARLERMLQVSQSATRARRTPAKNPARRSDRQGRPSLREACPSARTADRRRQPGSGRTKRSGSG
jgi:hypothetical protein